MADSIKIETVGTDGFTMDYFRFGNGDRTLVIIPGLSIDSVMKYADAVAGAYDSMTDEFTVYLFDRRKELPEEYSIYDMAHDTAAAISKLGLDHICLFGASQGGMIAMVIAIEYPELVSKLIVGSSSACIDQEQDPVIAEWIGLAKDKNAEGLYLAFGETVYPRNVFEQSRDLIIESAKSITDEDLSRFVILAGSIKGFDITDQLDKISCPVLVIGSNDDNVLGGEASEKIYEQLKDHQKCGLYMYDGYGHAVYDLAPDYRERMINFYKA